MKTGLKKISVFILFSYFISLQLKAADSLYGIRNQSKQFEFVKIDLLVDSVFVLNQLPNFYYTQNFSSSFNYIQQKYYLCFGQQLQVLDCLTGNLDTTFNFTSINPNYFIHTVFNPVDSFIYGIKLNMSTYEEVFSKFNPSDGTFTEINLITPEIGYGVGCKSAIDPFLGEYYLQSRTITTIRISDGQVLNDQTLQTASNEWIDHLAYSCDQRKLFGLSNNYHTVENYFSEIDESIGMSSHISVSSLPTSFYKQYLSGSTVDNSTDTYYYSTANGMLYGIDINSGIVVYSHDFGPNYQLLFLESSSSFDCTILKTDELSENSVSVYPNPGTGIFTIVLNKNDGEKYEIEITDINGKVISKKNSHSQDGLVFDLSEFAKGVYFYKLRNEHAHYFGKVILK